MTSLRSQLRRALPIYLATTVISAIVLTIALLSANVIVTMRDAANNIDTRRSVQAARAALGSIENRLSTTLRDNAIWDDAYTAGQSENIETWKEWIDWNWGSTSADYPLYDGVIVTDNAGNQISAFLKGEHFDAIAELGELFRGAARQESEHPSTDAKVHFYNIDGAIALVATQAIQPFEEEPENDALQTLTFFKSLTPEYVAVVAHDFQLNGLEVTRETPESGLQEPLKSPDGQIIGYLSWPDQKPGSIVYHEVTPKLWILAGLFVLFMLVLILFSSIALQKQRLRTLAAHHDATHDHLTGLLNRAGIIRAIDQAPAKTSFLHLIDLDGFKNVNDTWGHAVGDRLICRVADVLRQLHPEIKAAARLGGDEFALLQNGPTDPATISTLIVQLLKKPFMIDSRPVEIGASVGFVRKTSDTETLELIRRADMALYRAKAEGRGTYFAFEGRLDEERAAQSAAETSLRKAIEAEEIDVVYQPLVSTTSGRTIGVEALARWQSATGPISPDVFIPLAEQSGMIPNLSRLVLRKAIRAVESAPMQGLELSVNVSPIHLCSPYFSKEIMGILDEEQFEPTRLILEVTEGIFISNPDMARRSIDALRKLGVRFAMDDFGVGYASIATLRQIGFDKLKIDRSIIISGNDELLRATVQLANALDIPVTAEGIETEEQAEKARNAGCQLLQGFLFGRPDALMPAEKARAALQA